MSADVPAAGSDPVRAWLAQRPPLSRAQKYDRLAFTFCKVGTVGLIAWAVTPPIFVLVVALVAIYLYGRAVALGITRADRVTVPRPASMPAYIPDIRTGADANSGVGRRRVR